ncbi:MAG TPA: urease subunit gamma [Ktedonobacteraceae bacterium]|jgi:urease subunit gamma/beta|nr:urease subunit gamma [Ktedonobacteraceae bacterium]
MKLTPKEQDRLTIFTLAELARKRRARGVKLNYPEAVALICDEVMEEARVGSGYDEVITHGMQVLTEADVMEGVPELASKIYIEPLFDDGTKLVVLHHPIRRLGKDFGEKERISEPSLPDTIPINAGKPTITLTVMNTSDHPVQITSHMPFWEINQRMHFDREQARGYHLDIPAGGAIRWEPGETKEVRLCLLK